MRITEIKYEHKVPKAQYESELLSATAVVSEFENPVDAIEKLKQIVNKGLDETSVALDTPTKKEEKIVEKAKSTALPETKQGVEATTDVAPKEEKVETDAKDTEVKKVTKKKVAKKTTKKTVKKPTHIAYNREDDNHKKELGSYLGEYFPDWESDISKAGKLSASMTENKVPLYTKEGDIMQEFKDAVADGMSAK